MSKLKPCPFCGSKPLTYAQSGLIECCYAMCGVNPGCCSYKDWNQRAENEEVERLRKDRAGAVAQMSKSWQHNHENQSDLLTRYVEMANAQFEIMKRLRGERDEMKATLEKIHNSMAGNGEYGEFYYDVKDLLAKIKGES